MNILIVGGGGFLGSALVKHFAAQHRCLCFGHARNFAEMRRLIRGDVEYIDGDVTDAKLLSTVMARADAVIFAAGTGGEASCLSNPTQSLLTHVHGAHLVLREVQRSNVERFIFTSTISVYGTYEAHPMPLTEDSPLQPDEFYGALKLTAEREIIDSGRFQILRLANVYGRGSGLFTLASGVAGKFVDLVSQRCPLTVFGNGARMIDYVHIDDVCRVYETALSEAPGRNFIYNVGGGNPVSLRELAETCAQIAVSVNGDKPQIQYQPAPAKLYADRWLSIARIEREFNWRPQVGLAEGLREMFVNWPRAAVAG
jgi:UDP-glucose 4-epimerase